MRHRFCHRISGRSLSMLALFALTFCLATRPSSAAPAQLPITVTATPPAPGANIQISWTLKNTTINPLSGFIVFYIDSNNVTPLDLPNNLTIARNGSTGGSFTFANPGPGSHMFIVSMLTREGTPPVVTSHPLQPLAPGETPKPTTPHVTTPFVTFTATGFVRLDTSVPLPSLANGLTPAQKSTLLNTFAPLMLFSYDHGMQEQYAPLDILDFIKGSTLVSQVPNVIPSMSNASLQTPDVILGNSAVLGITTTHSTLPVDVYISPSIATEHATWNAVSTGGRITNTHVGLYGHVVLQNLANATDNVVAKGALPSPSQQSILQQELAGRYNCPSLSASCAQIIKIEYWQFFGYSHDYQNPTPLTNLIVPDATGILAALIDHGGDWCTVQLYVDAGWALNSGRPDKAILAVYHYAHGVQFGFDMQQVTNPNPGATTFQGFSIQQLHGPFNGQPVSMPYKPSETDASVQAAQNNILELAQDPSSKLYQHPVVYVEWGGHEFFPSSAWSAGEASKHDGSGQYHYIALGVPDIGEIAAANPTSDQARLITNYAGFWGYYGPDNKNKPPPGPPLHKQWMWDPDMAPALLNTRPSLSSLPF